MAKENLTIFQNFWNDVLKYRENGNLTNIEIKSRKVKTINQPILINQCLLYDENDY